MHNLHLGFSCCKLIRILDALRLAAATFKTFAHNQDTPHREDNPGRPQTHLPPAYLDISNISNRFQYQAGVDCMRPHCPQCSCEVGLLLCGCAAAALEGVVSWCMHLSCYLVHNNYWNPECFGKGLEDSCLLTCTEQRRRNACWRAMWICMYGVCYHAKADAL